jgi:hypothetical protein
MILSHLWGFVDGSPTVPPKIKRKAGSQQTRQHPKRRHLYLKKVKHHCSTKDLWFITTYYINLPFFHFVGGKFPIFH